MFGCAGPRAPLEEIRETLAGVPTFSVILDDMKEEGNFFKTYYHKYAIVTEEDRTTTEWLEVPKDTFQKYLPFLRMTIWVKKDGKGSGNIGPPGYEYVGNSWYGRWHTDASGRSFWVFYGQYRLFSDLLGPGPIYRNHYTTYTNYRSQQRPYYGPNREYGTNGSLTRRQKPNFYSRRMSGLQTQKASFASKVNKRIGRTKTSVRGRSTRVGK
jgi:hypothetical protein